MEAYISLISATALLLGSPGPAPLALAATGATYGVKRGVPFLFGILVGLSFAIVGATAGLATLFLSFPELKLVCQIIGASYIAYIALKIATAPIISSITSPSAPRFKDGFILNLLNPKAYAAFLAIFSQFLLADSVTGYVLTGITCLLVATVVDAIWLGFGGILRPVFSEPKQARVIRVVFALLMLIAVVFALV